MNIPATDTDLQLAIYRATRSHRPSRERCDRMIRSTDDVLEAVAERLMLDLLDEPTRERSVA